MRGQGLPVSTIIIVLLGVLVLAMVVIFFYFHMKSSKGEFESQEMLNKCQRLCAQLTTVASQGGEVDKSDLCGEGKCEISGFTCEYAPGKNITC